MSAIPSRSQGAQRLLNKNVTALIPDFPFHYARYLWQAAILKKPLGHVAPQHYGEQVLIVGAGVSGLVAAYEAMRMGLHPIVVEASGRIGGRLYSQVVGDRNDPHARVICELGAMRFPKSGKALMHYFNKVGMDANSTDFPNPGSLAAPVPLSITRTNRRTTNAMTCRKNTNESKTCSSATSSSRIRSVLPTWKMRCRKPRSIRAKSRQSGTRS